MSASFPIPRRLFLFDLDGTLIDSRRDIALSVNLALERLGLPSLPESRVVDFVGDGVDKLVLRALRESRGGEPGPEILRQGLSVLIEEYGRHLMDYTRLYPGVREMLAALDWGTFGVVSNKLERFSRSVLSGFGLADHFCVIFGGDTFPQRKPDPTPLLRAMEICGAAPGETVMVGDSPADILAGKAAGVFTCGFGCGFRSPEELRTAGCDILVQSLLDLPRYFRPLS
ncbi:MAG: HAD-IA family hydrolase [Acidobacteriota bacterium]